MIYFYHSNYGRVLYPETILEAIRLRLVCLLLPGTGWDNQFRYEESGKDIRKKLEL